MRFWDPVDFRLQLSATDYGNFLANEPLPLSTATIGDKVGLITWGDGGVLILGVGDGEARGGVQLYSNQRCGTAGDVHGLHYVSTFTNVRNCG